MLAVAGPFDHCDVAGNVPCDRDGIREGGGGNGGEEETESVGAETSGGS